MKKYLLLLFVLFKIVATNAANLYWIGGTGSWNDAKHWSALSGGATGGLIPSMNDNVFFDRNSFSADKQTVMVTADAVCHNFDWSDINKHSIFSGVNTKKHTVSGSLTLSPLMIYGFKGQTEFTSSSSGNTISTNANIIYSNWIFNGTGSWILNDEITTASNVTISLLKGNLNTNDKHIVCGSFTGNSSQARTLTLGNSDIVVKNIWDFSNPTNLIFDAGNSSILFNETIDNRNFRSGGLRYSNVSVSILSQNTTTCVFPEFTVTLTADSVTCNSLCDGAAHVVVTGGSGAPVFDWNFGATPAGDFTANITGLCASTNTVKVTEVILGVTKIHFCSISVGEPPPLNDFEALSTQPLCFGNCNGFMDVDETGGTPPYTYSWSGGLGTNDSAINVCAGTYTATVTDSRGCTDASAVITLTAPNLLVAPGSATMVSCNGVCDGTASVIVSGGTAPYSYNWTPGNPPGDGTPNITGLCAVPGTFTCTVTDLNGCTAIFDTVITQPLVLTLVMSHTNASCNGVCDGTATATVSGGTPNYLYSWSNGSITSTASTTNTVSALCAGPITVNITDANGCTQTNNVTITQPGALIATATGVNITCFGLCNGTATVSVVGGTAAFTYSWVGPAGFTAITPSISALCAGLYTVTVTDANGCTSVSSVTIIEPPVLLANPLGTNITCFGICNGSATSTPTGGTPPYGTFDWSPGAPTGDFTPTITNLCPGVFTVLVTDVNLCSSSQNVTITQPPVINTGLTFTNVTCNGACNGTATSSPSGGVGPYTFSWAPGGAITPTISGLCPGVYTVTVTDANGCTKIGSVTITQPIVLTVSITSTALSCNGDCNAIATATIVGGTPPFTIDWLPGNPVGDGTTVISSLCAGTYTINVTDLNGCVATANITILQPTPLTIVTATTNVSCFGICDGVAAAIGGGGTPAYSFSWAPGGQTTSSISGQCAGSYTVTLTDFKGCIIKDTVVITEPNQLLANPSVVTNISCAGVLPCDGSATSAPTGGTIPYTYDWTPGAPAGDGTPTITALCAGIYNLTVTDLNLCTSTMPVTITQPLVLSAPITGSTSSCNICNGTATCTPVGGTGVYTYLWMPTGQTTQTAVGLCPNITYTVTVTDANGCTATSSATILQTIIINITTSNTTLSCFGACDGIATANAGGGTPLYSFIWTGPSPSGTIVSLTATAMGLCAGTYIVNVSDAAGCFNSDSVTFTNPPVLTVSTTGTNLTCGGVCTGTGTATPVGGTGADTYLWMPGGQTTQTATALCAGTYTVTVTDSSGCTAIDSVIITQPPVVVDNVTITPANCLFADGVISVIPTGGAGAGSYTYDWNGAASPTGDGTSTITGLLPGAYTLAITSGGCVFNFNYLLGNTTGPTLVMSHTDVSCNNACDGTATVVASGGAGGYIYDWTPGAPIGDGTASIISLCGTTTYVVTVTDAAGCINLGSATIINPTLISPNPAIVSESCGGTCDGSISLVPTGGTGPYTYLWTGGQVTPSISGLCAGAYTFTVTDANGCDSTLTIVLVSPPALIVTLSSTDVTCNGFCDGTASAGVVGGTGPGTYSYSWLPAPPLGPGFPLPNVVGLCPNSYFITVTDGNGCTAKDTAIIAEPVALTTITSQTNVSCNGICDGTATVTPAGGTGAYAYSWSPAPALGQITPTATALCAGTYNATVTDANGCVSSPPGVTITQPTVISPNATFVNPTCNNSCNGTATANPTGGSGIYTYSWNSVPAQPTQTATSLCAGTYIVTVTDGNGCSNTQSVTLVDLPVLNANATSTSPTCANGCNGTAISNPTGGTGTYSYFWTPPAIGLTTQSILGLCSGVYTIVVTDGNTCKDTQNISVINPPQINIVVGSTPATCGACDGTISIVPITGTAAYTYVWTIGGVAPPLPFAGNGTPNVTNVCAGLYDVLVTDANGCDSTFTIPMNNSSGPTGETENITDATCFGSCNGAASVTPIGGLPLYTYLWNDGPGTTLDTAFNLCAGNYFVQVTDASGCIHFSPVTINEPAPIISNGIVTSAVCSNVCTGAVTVVPSGGTPGYSYVWTPGVIVGQGTPSVTGLCPGTYTLVITDANLCTKIDSFVVGQSTPLAATIASINISCSSACNGVAYVTITSGTAPYSIQWNDPSGQTNDTASALCAGNYSVDITDANGCIVTLSTTITATPAIAANPTITNASCGLCDGSAVLVPSGGTAGYTYLWSNGQIVANAINLCSGLYTVNITDAAGCVANVSIPVSNTGGPTSATIVSTNISCNGLCNGAVTSVTPVGGSAPYTFLWIAGGQTTPTLAGLCAGTYFVQITDANGCSLMDSVIITEPSPILANQVISAASCGLCDGTITITPSGGTAGYTILWNTGSTVSPLINLCAGVYSVDITDAAGCIQNVTIPLNSQSGPTLTTFATNVSCNASCNGTDSVFATGSSPFAYLWNDVALQTTPVTTPTLCAGTYFVQVTDAAGCVSIASSTVTEPPVIGFSVANAVDPLCNGNANGSITTIPSGGTLSYTYSWSPSGGSAATATSLAANTYIVTVTDANGCIATQTVILTNPVSLTISDVATNPSCNSLADGSIDVTVGGGTLPYAYQWSGSSVATTQDLAGILSGSYTITVTDTNFCTIVDTIILIPTQTVIANVGNDTSFCQAGSLILSAASSINGVNYQWFDMTNTLLGSTVTLTVNPPSGTTSYYVIVDNGTGCPDNDTINVTSNPVPTASAGPDVTIVIGANTTIGGSPTTTSAGATIQWTPTPGALDNSTIPNPLATPITTTTYTVTVTTAAGCSSSDSMIVTVRPTIIFPDGISPNGDGANDEWIIDGIELFPDCVVEVYNRWGELLFQSVGYKEHWKGTYKNKPLPVGTYYYIVDLKDPLFPDAYTGPITILR